jgi:hypothetical protein
MNLRAAIVCVCTALALCVGVQALWAVPPPTASWATQAGGTGDDFPSGISALHDGSSIVTGSFEGTATFGRTTFTSTGDLDIFAAKMNADGTWAWAVKAGGTGTDVGYAISTLPDGSSLVTGYFIGTATFGSITLTSAGNFDVFAAKLNADGTWAWATSAGGVGAVGDNGYGIAALPDGSSIVTGEFDGSATFGNTTLTGAGSVDIFTAKVNADGTWAWAISAGGSGLDEPYGMSALPDGSSIVAGYFMGTARFGTTTLASTGSTAMFTAKVNADGTWGWAIKVGGTGFGNVSGVSTLRDGSSIVTGNFAGTAIFGTTTLSSTSNEVFAAKVKADGTWVWATQAGGSGVDGGKGVSVLPDGSSVVTGTFEGTAAFGATTLTSQGSQDVFTAKLNVDGAWSWVAQAGGAGADTGFAVSALSDGSSFVAGRFSGTATFGTTTLTSTGAGDAFTASYLEIPQAVSAPAAVAGDMSATVTIAPLAGGSITSYTVTADSGEKTCTIAAPKTSCTVEGLGNGISYRFRAAATNRVGTGPASGWSNAVTPTAAPPAAKTAVILKGTARCVAATCVTTGPAPAGATRITQSATAGAGATSFALGFARANARTARGTCRITTTGSGAHAKRTYTCTIRLSKGNWTLTTKALSSKGAVMAKSVRRVRVTSARSPAVTG